MIRVLIVDDHPIVHDGIAAVLHHEADIRVIGSAETTARAVEQVRSLKPDVVLMDLRMPGEEGLSGLETLVTACPGHRIIVFTASDADEYVFGAMQAGARGYVLKGASGPELVRAIRHVHAGEAYLSPTLGARLVDRTARPAGRTAILTARQLAILRLVAAGQSNQQIAQSLGITERTVKFHLTAIFNRLGADNRAQAVALAGRRGLLSID